jgi:DNA ligase-1
MNRFTRLFDELDATTRTVDKLAALRSYFQQAPPADAAWALNFLIGRKVKRAINTRLLREWIVLETGLPGWLVEECYDSVGDLAEALALLLPDQTPPSELSLAGVVETFILPLRDLPPEGQHARVRESWSTLGPRQRLVWHKLIMGEFRVGVARTLVARALAEVAGISAAEMSHRLMGSWSPTEEDYRRLVAGGAASDISQPYPFFLAHPLDGPPHDLGERCDWQAEWKWDGIRAQLIRRQGEVLIWSRGEELVTDRFPEVQEWGGSCPRAWSWTARYSAGATMGRFRSPSCSGASAASRSRRGCAPKRPSCFWLSISWSGKARTCAVAHWKSAGRFWNRSPVAFIATSLFASRHWCKPVTGTSSFNYGPAPASAAWRD